VTVRPDALEYPWRFRPAPGKSAGDGLWSHIRSHWHRLRRRNRFEFAIGMYEGPSPTELTAISGVRNPVMSWRDVTDRDAAFVADPFMLRVDGLWYMFFEVASRATHLGEIGLATSHDAREWRYQQIVLSETFHLSYPHVFAWDGAYYMIPECYQSGGARLYRAEEFPHRWTSVATLMERPVLLDSTVFRHDGHWWMFAETNPKHKQDCLRLFYSNELLGPWHEHSHSPIIHGDPSRSRPAGRVVRNNGNLVRFAQNCGPEYGTAVRAFEIVELTPERYHEQELSDLPILGAGRERWNRLGMHHVDAHELAPGHWIACVDGR
jgi:hypothetical protein